MRTNYILAEFMGMTRKQNNTLTFRRNNLIIPIIYNIQFKWRDAMKVAITQLVVLFSLFCSTSAPGQTYFPQCTNSGSSVSDGFAKTSTIGQRTAIDLPIEMDGEERLHCLLGGWECPGCVRPPASSHNFIATNLSPWYGDAEPSATVSR